MSGYQRANAFVRDTVFYSFLAHMRSRATVACSDSLVQFALSRRGRTV